MNKFTKTIAGIVAVVALVAVSAVSASAASYTRSLTIGSNGTDVTELQMTLVAKGYLVMPTGVAYGYFGTLTKNAVAAFQTANGITPAAGYFGPITMAKLAAGGSMTSGTSMVAGCTSTSGFSPTTGQKCDAGGSMVPGCVSTSGFSTTTGASCASGSTSNGSLSGTDGSINDVIELSQYNNEEVGEGQSDVKVLGFEVEASNDGDIMIKSVKVSFDPTGNTGSDHLDDYIEGVKVWMGSKEVGSANVDDFSQDNNDLYTRTITLSNVVVKAEDTEKFYVSVDGANNFDSSDISGDSWTVDLENVRYEDGSGVVTTDTDSGDIDGMDVAIDFVTFSTSADTELKISTDSATPEAGIVIIDETSNTDDVVVLKGKIKVDGTSDVLLDEFPVTLTTVGGANVSAVTGSVKLTIDGNDYTESVNITGATTGTVTFDNLGIDLTAGKTYSFTVSADINDIDTGNLDEGDTLVVSVTATNRDYIDAENEEGDQLSDSSEKSGTATGEAQEFRVTGVQLSLVSTNTSVTTGTGSNDDQGTFTIRFKVKAIGDNVYVSTLADATLSSVTTGKTSVHADKAGTATVTGVSAVITNVSDTTLTSVGNYEIEDGSEETFELTTLITHGSDLYRAVLGGVSWSTTDERLPASAYTSALDTFKTSYIALN